MCRGSTAADGYHELSSIRELPALIERRAAGGR